MIAVDIVLFIVGLVILLYGADKLTDAAGHIAHMFGVHPMIIGMTILSIGTSIPEMATSIASFANNTADVALGNIVGSDLVQITLILGLVALLRPLKGKRKEILFYGLTSVIAVLLAVYTIRDGMLDWFDGIILVGTYILFLAHIIGNEHIKKHHFKKKGRRKLAHLSLICAGTFVLVFIGSTLLVRSTLNIASFFAIPEFWVAVFAVGLGTSIPELIVSGVAAYKKKYSLGVGNLLGSNITDPTLSLGIGALFSSGTAIKAVAAPTLWYLVFCTLLIVSVFAWKKKVTRPMAVGILGLYIISFFFI